MLPGYPERFKAHSSLRPGTFEASRVSSRVLKARDPFKGPLGWDP